MSEARSVEEAVRSVRSALYELQLQPQWNGGATRAEIVRYCLSRELPTPERFFEAAIELVDTDKTTTNGYHPSMADVRYALTRGGRSEVERENRDRRTPYLDQLPQSPEAQAAPPLEMFSRRAASLPQPFRSGADLTQRSLSLTGARTRWNALPEPLKLFLTFGVGMITGMVVSNLRL